METLIPTIMEDTDKRDYRFWVETIFLFVVLVFCMVQLARNSSDQPVYFTIISGICGKITKLKIKKNITGSSTGNPLFLDEVDGSRSHYRTERTSTVAV